MRALGCDRENDDERSCSPGVGWMVAGAVFAAAAVALDGVLDRETVSRRAASLPIGLAVREGGALLTARGAL